MNSHELLRKHPILLHKLPILLHKLPILLHKHPIILHKTLNLFHLTKYILYDQRCARFLRLPKFLLHPCSDNDRRQILRISEFTHFFLPIWAQNSVKWPGTSLRGLWDSQSFNFQSHFKIFKGMTKPRARWFYFFSNWIYRDVTTGVRYQN